MRHASTAVAASIFAFALGAPGAATAQGTPIKIGVLND